MDAVRSEEMSPHFALTKRGDYPSHKTTFFFRKEVFTFQIRTAKTAVHEAESCEERSNLPLNEANRERRMEAKPGVVDGFLEKKA